MKFEKPPPAFGLSELKAQLCNKEVEMDDDGKVWKWEVWPHPYSNDFDCFVTDSDDEAREAISILAEMYLWDGNDGGERTVKVVHNASFSREPERSGGESAGSDSYGGTDD